MYLHVAPWSPFLKTEHLQILHPQSFMLLALTTFLTILPLPQGHV